MEEDVIIHGQLTEFRSNFRCEACQLGNRKCIIQENDERCMLCTDADRHCNFIRQVAARGPRSAFGWEQLLSQQPVGIVDSNDYITTLKTMNIDRNTSGSKIVNTKVDRADNSNSATTLPVRQMMAELPKHQRQYLPDHGLHRSARMWRKAIWFCISIVAFKAAGDRHQSRKSRRIISSTEASTCDGALKVEGITKSRVEEPWVFNNSNQQKLPSVSSEKSGSNVLVLDPQNNMALYQPRTRYLSPSGREHAKRMRKVGACSDCRDKKKRCTHVLLGSVSGSEVSFPSEVSSPSEAISPQQLVHHIVKSIDQNQSPPQAELPASFSPRTIPELSGSTPTAPFFQWDLIPTAPFVDLTSTPHNSPDNAVVQMPNSSSSISTSESRWVCPDCGQMFIGQSKYLMSNLQRHMKAVHSKPKSSYVCAYEGCQTKFTRRDNLALHQKKMHHTVHILPEVGERFEGMESNCAKKPASRAHQTVPDSMLEDLNQESSYASTTDVPEIQRQLQKEKD